MRLPLRDHRRLSVPRAISLLVFHLFALAAWAQPTLLNSTEAVFHHPESAVYDARHKCIDISNLDKDTPMDALHTDPVSRMLPEGTFHLSSTKARVSNVFPPSAESWVDSLDNYARNKFLPAKKYNWTWQQAALLRSMTAQYDLNVGPDRSIYLDYVRTAMDKSMHAAYAGHNPNGMASGFGLAWLARVTGEAKYRDAAIRLYQKYLEIPRAANGGVTHLRGYRELWDDTVFMVGIYLLEMYLLTNDEMYLNELLLQVEAHREKLQVAEWGLWVHGWDGDDKDHCRLCSQQGWSKNAGNRSTEIWGRGNGWVVVTLTQVVESIPKTHPQWPRFAGYLKEMLVHLPELQDTTTGHWFQLPVYPHEAGNYIESSCTAMFGYGIAGGLRMGIVEGEAYQRSVERAYSGLRKYSMEQKGGGYLMTKNICTGTCIGDKDYYFKRGAGREKSFGIGMFLLFGRGNQ